MARKINFKESEGGDKIPMGVKGVSILFYIGTIICFFLGLFMIISSGTMVASLIATNPGMGLESIPSGTLVTLMIVLGTLFIIAGIISFFIGRGIWKLKNWARLTAIILAILGFIFTIFSIITSFAFTNIITLLIDGYIWGYLLFSKEAKKVFK